MSEIRVMWIGKGPSGLPEDRVVNTFHFIGGGSYSTDSELALDAVADFYNGSAASLNAAAQLHTISSYLSPWVGRASELRAYDLTTPPQRIPTIRALTLSDGQSLSGMPEEVALCLSYSGSPPLTPRRRGRIYIGPFIFGASEPASTANPSRPNANLVPDLAKAALRLMGLNSPGPQWHVRSTRPEVNYVLITRGYVDNAWDTQIRRGPDASGRVSFTGLLGLL